MADDPPHTLNEVLGVGDLVADRNARMLQEALRLGDDMSTRIADHSLRLRRARRAMQSAVYMLECGRTTQAHKVLVMALTETVLEHDK